MKLSELGVLSWALQDNMVFLKAQSNLKRSWFTSNQTRLQQKVSVHCVH